MLPTETVKQFIIWTFRTIEKEMVWIFMVGTAMDATLYLLGTPKPGSNNVCPFSFGHSVVSSSIYDSDYPFVILKLFLSLWDYYYKILLKVRFQK